MDRPQSPDVFVFIHPLQGPVGTVDENAFSPEEKNELEQLFQLWPSWEAFDKATQFAKDY